MNWRPAIARSRCKRWPTEPTRPAHAPSAWSNAFDKRVSPTEWRCATASPWMFTRAGVVVWLRVGGGLGRLDEDISSALLKGARNNKLSIEKVEEILATVSIDSQRLLLNTLGGRMPYGYRIAGADGADVAERVMTNIDRTLRRWKTVAQRLDEAMAQSAE